MKECTKCNFNNDDDSGFCGKCGQALARPNKGATAGNNTTDPAEIIKCKKCNAENNPEAKFCGSCAAVLTDDKWQADWIAEGNQKLGVLPYVIAWLSFIPGTGIIFGIVAIIWGVFTRKKGGPKLAVIGLCGVLLSVALVGYLLYFGFKRTGRFADGWAKLTVMQADETIQAIEFYKVKTGKYPGDLNELVSSLPPESANVDNDPSSIGRTLYYELINKDQYYLFSVGNDGTPFTKDDILPSIKPGGNMGYTVKK